MIEITGKLVRGPVYLSGETVECWLTFRHVPTATHTLHQSNDDTLESLAWASAQIHCQSSRDARLRAKTPVGRLGPTASSDTSLATWAEAAAGSALELSTKPRILFCDLRLSPGESRTFVYRERLPADAPPSFRGQLVKYSYKIVVGTQRVNSAIRLLRVPFRVLPINTAGLTDAAGLCNDTSDDLSPANPFLETTERETPVEVALQALQNLTARRSPNSYMISNRRGRVARFCLFKSAYKLGEDVVGTLDFSVASVRCVQVSVSLQCEEETSGGHTRLLTYSKHHEVCLGLRYSQLVLPVPLHVTPAFTTPLVTLRWRLHFEFVTSVCEQLQPQDTVWRAPANLPIETMVWSLPVRLFSSAPIHVAQGLQPSPPHKLIMR